MTKEQQMHYVYKKLIVIHGEIIALLESNISNIQDWSGPELNQYIADSFDDRPKNSRMTKEEKRKYYKTISTTNL